MLQQAISWGTSYVDGLLLSYHGCCCSGDSRADNQGNAKCGDLVVMTDWDTDEHARSTIGYSGQFNEPPVSKALEPGMSPDGGGAAGSSPPVGGRSAPAPAGTAPRELFEGGVPQTPRAAAGSSGGNLETQSPLGCGPPPGRDPDEGSSSAAAREALALRELMKRFVQEMVHGRELQVVVGEGRTEPCKLTLTPNLMYLQLEASGVTHDIPLRNVKDVCPGKLQSSKLVPVELDDLCDTVVLRNNECVTFRLTSIKERDEFTKCVKVLALALEQ